MTLTHDATDKWSRLWTRVCVDRPCSPPVLAGLAGAVAIVVAAAAVLRDATAVRWMVALAAGAALAYVVSRSFEQGVVATFMWLLVLGLARRLLSTFQADPASDPLLLIAPVLAAGLWVIAMARGAWQSLSLLACGVIGMSGLAIVETINPTQGRWTAGVRGLLFWLVPMLWFWIGRVASTALVERILRLVTVVAGLAAMYGLWQALVGFPPWDRQWIDQRGYIALQINGPDTLRQFAFSSSAGEYALLLTVGLLMCTLYLARGWNAVPRRWLALALPVAGILVMAPALALVSVRTAVVLLVLALAVVFVVASGWGSALAVTVGAVALAVLWFLVSRINTDRMSDRGPSGMVRRTVRGLADPFGRDSTLRTHLDYFRDGVRAAIDRPFGVGTSAGTPVGRGVENDVANGGLAFGILGLVGVVWCLVFGFVAAYRAISRHRGVASLATLGVLVLSLRFWWNGAHYAPAALLWFLLGWADAATHRASELSSDVDERQARVIESVFGFDRRVTPPVRPVLLGLEWPTARAGGLNRYVSELHRSLRTTVDGSVDTVVFGPVPSDEVGVHAAGPASAPLPLRLVRQHRLIGKLLTSGSLVDAHFALVAAPNLRRLHRAGTPLVTHFHGPWADEAAAEGRRVGHGARAGGLSDGLPMSTRHHLPVRVDGAARD